MHTPRKRSYNRGRSPQLGASILAALVFVGILGVVALTLQGFSKDGDVQTVAMSVNKQSQSAQATTATAPAASTPAKVTPTINDQCNPGEVHTVKETGNATKVPQDNVTKCYIPDTSSTVTPPPLVKNTNITTADDKAACNTLKGEINTCVVRYCPLESKVKQEGTCVVATCKAGMTDTCLRDVLTSAITKPDAVTAIQEIRNGGPIALTNPDGTLKPTVNGSADLSAAFTPGTAYGVLGSQFVQNKNDLAATDQQLQDCIASGCDPAQRSALETKINNLQSENTDLQMQMKSLAAQGTVTMQSPANETLFGGTNPNLTQMSCASDKSECYPDPDEQKILQQQKWTCATDSSDNTVVCKPPGQQQGPPNQPPCGTLCNGGGNGGVTRGPSNINGPQNQGGLGGALSSLFGGGQQRPGQPSAAYTLGQMIGSLIGGNNGGSQIACATNQDMYNQQMQQYQQQQQQYNSQLQQYNYQQQQSYYYYGGGGGYSSPPPQQPQQIPQPCYNNQNPQQCQNSPQQPDSSGCTGGTMKPTTAAGNGCISGWQCVPNSSNGQNPPPSPLAQLSCQPHAADAGMSLAVSFACQNSTTAKGSGFDTAGQLSGSATTTISAPPAGANTATYTLTCSNGAATSNAQCSVQVGTPAIVLVANPKAVHAGNISTIGWITSGMQSCVIGSPEMQDFTTRNADNTSVNGVSTTSPITGTVNILLHCTTLGGMTKDATTSVSVL